MDEIDQSLRKKAQKREIIERRIGRWLGRNTLSEKVFTVKVNVDKEKNACSLSISENESKLDWAYAGQGAYLLRNNYREKDPKRLWRWYIQLTQVEDAFRCTKSDLGLRPVYHHKKDRVQAHIFICFLALVMWRMLEMWLQSKGLGNCARQVLLELEKLRSMDIVLPIKKGKEARLRLVGKPDKLTADLLHKMNLKIPTRPKIIENVVQKNR